MRILAKKICKKVNKSIDNVRKKAYNIYRKLKKGATRRNGLTVAKMFDDLLIAFVGVAWIFAPGWLACLLICISEKEV